MHNVLEKHAGKKKNEQVKAVIGFTLPYYMPLDFSKKRNVISYQD